MDLDSPWDDTANQDASRDIEWNRISSEFINVGYREGITAGKESALQEGFDTGFASVGAPLGREIGLARGRASALVAFLNSPACERGLEEKTSLLVEARAIAAGLAGVRFSDVVPRDLEAEEHARQHLAEDGDDDGVEENEELSDKRKMESLEDMLARLTAGATGPAMGDTKRPTMDEVRLLQERLEMLSMKLGLVVDRS